MALRAVQITLVSETPTPLLVKGVPSDSNTVFRNATGGSVQDPVPVSIKNEDASDVVWIGGPDVSDTYGQSLAPGATMVMNLYGSSEVPFAWCDGTPIVSVLAGRQ